jgi:conjugal transfer pilus assembly protein TraU
MLKRLCLKRLSFAGLLAVITPLLFLSAVKPAKAAGHFYNPISDTCWECVFPIKIGSAPVTGSLGFADTPSYPGVPAPICWCNRPPLGIPLPGISLSVWMPSYLVEVVRRPFTFPFLDLSLAPPTPAPMGTAQTAKGGEGSFYQVHAISYPLFAMMQIVGSSLCQQTSSAGFQYLTELDPTWNDSILATLLAPEAVLVSNMAGALACVGDCLAEIPAAVPLPQDLGGGLLATDSLFWCSGCLGFVYPMVGEVSQSTHPIQSSSLLVARMVARLHRTMQLTDTTGPTNYTGACQPIPYPFLKKSQYKIQLIYPRPEPFGFCCRFLGAPTDVYSAFQNFPVQGEDFGYLLWQKRECCSL